MTKIVCEGKVDVRRSVGMHDTDWLDRDKKACRAWSMELKDAKFSAHIERS